MSEGRFLRLDCEAGQIDDYAEQTLAAIQGWADRLAVALPDVRKAPGNDR